MTFQDLKRAVRSLSKAGTRNETEIVVTQDSAVLDILRIQLRRKRGTQKEQVAIAIESGTETFEDDEISSGVSKEEWLAEHPDDDEGPTGDGWEGFE